VVLLKLCCNKRIIGQTFIYRFAALLESERFEILLLRCIGQAHVFIIIAEILRLVVSQD